jgi:hypothetical protein
VIDISSFEQARLRRYFSSFHLKMVEDPVSKMLYSFKNTVQLTFSKNLAILVACWFVSIITICNIMSVGNWVLVSQRKTCAEHLEWNPFLARGLPCVEQKKEQIENIIHSALHVTHIHLPHFTHCHVLWESSFRLSCHPIQCHCHFEGKECYQICGHQSLRQI